MTPPANSEKKWRVAFLGTGYIADWHAQSIQFVKNVELVAVCDRILPKAQALAQKFGVPKSYASLEEMLASEKLDAIHILLPPNLHFQAAQTILLAGVNVFMEKPMCDRPEDCDTLVQLAAERNLRLGIGHNFLFAEPYEQLRRDLYSGLLGQIDHITLTWNRVLPQTHFGPFDLWLLREPHNIMLEIGSHSVAHLLDLTGQPTELRVHAGNPVTLPTGKNFYRRWQVNATHKHTAIDLNFSFVPGFSEYSLHLRGSLAAATVDFEANTYSLHRHHPISSDFDTRKMARDTARSLTKQSRRTLKRYLLSKLKIGEGSSYGSSIARAMEAFYSPQSFPLDSRITGETGAKVIRLCRQIGQQANLPAPLPLAPVTFNAAPPKILVLGATGFIGKELVSQLIGLNQPVRILVRGTASLPAKLRSPLVQTQIGDITNRADLEQAFKGIETVIHLARPHVNTWPEYQQLEIAATEQLAEVALAANIKRLLYTGTIDSFNNTTTTPITETTPLDPRIASRNLYARAKAASEAILTRFHREKNLPVVLLRPGIVIGSGGSPFHWGVGMWWHDSIVETWGPGNTELPFVLVEDVASGLIAAISTPNIEGHAFNLVAGPCLTAQQYLDELDRAAGIKIQRHATSLFKFYLIDMAKWLVKIAVRHHDRRMPSLHDWQNRGARAPYDTTQTRNTLNWNPTSTREQMVQKGIATPAKEFTT